MSQLVTMRNRIKAIKTIKKITHAMRLISMSHQTKLKKQYLAMSNYIESISSLFKLLQRAAPEWSHPIFKPIENKKHLLIFIGSQKGLCGNFNTNIIRTLNNKSLSENTHIIVIGKQLINHLIKQFSNNIIYSEKVLSTRNMQIISQNISSHIMKQKTPYSHIFIHSNLFKSFFTQEAMVNSLIPVKKETSSIKNALPDYIWEQDQKEILDTLAKQYLDAHINYYLFQSLLSEYASRFVSMDNATRNADSLLEITTRTYNKLRQTKITTEITELSSNF